MSPEYRSPETDNSLDAKFVRTERCIFVSDGVRPSHINIAKADKLTDIIARLKAANPTEVDAGFVHIRNGVIYISDESPTLDLPVYGFNLKAREITLSDFAKQSPGFTVSELKK